MNLVIDIGNTSSKLAIFEGEEISRSSRLNNLSISNLKDFIGSSLPDRAIISCVGSMPAGLADYLSSTNDLLPFTGQTPVPIENKYKTPNTLGLDRIALAVGANSLYPNSNTLAIDAGTTITYDLVTEQGHYIGGAISPGVGLRFRSLNQHTQNLPLLSATEEFEPIGTDTNSCILAGVLAGVTNEVDGYIDMVRHRYPNLVVLITGGDLFFFEKKLKNSIFANPNLVLIGLNRILNHNA